jgi:hypothetical protein
MLYLKGETLRLIILETGNLEELRKGRPASTPDKECLICWTPAPRWLAKAIRAANTGDALEIARLVQESLAHAQEEVGPHFPTVVVDLPTIGGGGN